MDALLRARDVARLLNLRVSTLYSLCHRGSIPYVRLDQGKKRSLIRFRESDLQRMIAERTMTGRREE